MKIRLIALFLFCLTCLSSCIYKMPNEDSYSLIPSTNNPTFIGIEDKAVMPNQAEF